MKKLLLTTVCRPLGPKHGDAPSVGYELLYGQVTRAQGIFSPRANHVQYSLEYIANNVDAPTTALHYPSKRQLIKELKKGYDFIGVAFILSTFHRMKEIVALVRRYAPRTKIILGGYGTVLSDEELGPLSDYICREEGVGFTRRVLGEAPRPLPYEHPLVVSQLKVFSIPVSRTGMVFAGLGCANGCDFCCTSHFFKRRHIKLLPTGKAIFDVMARYQDEHGVDQFTILDEDFLLNKTRAMEFHKCVKESGRTFGMFAFGSIRALSQYTPNQLLEMGIDGLWIGYEGTRSGYSKQQGRQPAELFPDLRRHGISILASMIVGFDYQDHQVVRDELRGLLRLQPTLSQFLIYGPTPGTPFYDRVMKEKLLRPEAIKNREGYYKNCTGFVSLVKHPTLSKKDIEDLQEECFQADFQRLGPSIYRTIRAWLAGYQINKNSPVLSLRKKAMRFGKDARRSYPLMLAGRIFAPNARVRRWIRSLERRMHRELGSPTLVEQALSWAAVGAAAWTRVTLCFDVFQHPRIPAHRFRWETPLELFMRFWGETLDNGRTTELVGRLEKQAAGVSWLHLEGIMDRKNTAELGRAIREKLENSREKIVLQFEKIQSIDRNAMAEFYRALSKHRGQIQVVVPRALLLLKIAPELKRFSQYFGA